MDSKKTRTVPFSAYFVKILKEFNPAAPAAAQIKVLQSLERFVSVETFLYQTSEAEHSARGALLEMLEKVLFSEVCNCARVVFCLAVAVLY